MPQKLTTTACFIQEESSDGLPSEDSSWMKQAVVIQEESSDGLPSEDSSWMKQAVVVSF